MAAWTAPTVVLLRPLASAATSPPPTTTPPGRTPPETPNGSPSPTGTATEPTDKPSPTTSPPTPTPTEVTRVEPTETARRTPRPRSDRVGRQAPGRQPQRARQGQPASLAATGLFAGTAAVAGAAAVAAGGAAVHKARRMEREADAAQRQEATGGDSGGQGTSPEGADDVW